jgi:hypothetical protein
MTTHEDDTPLGVGNPYESKFSKKIAQIVVPGAAPKAPPAESGHHGWFGKFGLGAVAVVAMVVVRLAMLGGSSPSYKQPTYNDTPPPIQAQTNNNPLFLAEELQRQRINVEMHNNPQPSRGGGEIDLVVPLQPGPRRLGEQAPQPQFLEPAPLPER